MLSLVLLANPLWGQFARPIPIPRSVPVPHFIPHVGIRGGSSSEDVVWIIGIVVAAIVAVAVLALVIRGLRKRMATLERIRIIATPPGEAPENIRRAWIGLELPLLRGENQPRVLDTMGVLSHQLGHPTTGYIVEGKNAVELLETHAPTAATWWRENAPQVVASGYQLIFPAEVCEKLNY
jgi:hypothetical protein